MKRTLKSFLWIAISALTILGITDRVLWNLSVDFKRQNFDSNQLKQLSHEKTVSRVYFSSKIRSIQGLQLTIEDVISRGSTLDSTVVADLMLAYGRGDNALDQLRVLDLEGKERVRLEFRPDRGWISVSNDGLQDKSHRPYFKEMIGVAPGTFYVSDIDLNRENDTLELPYKPVLRFAFPIYSEARKMDGILVANYRMEGVLKELASRLKGPLGGQHVVNDAGYFITSSLGDITFGDLIEERSSYHLSQVIPDLHSRWSSIQGDTVIHLSDHHYYISLVQMPGDIIDTEQVTISNPENWTLIRDIPTSVLEAHTKDHMEWWRVIEVTVIIVVLLFSFLVSYQRNKLRDEKRLLTSKVEEQTIELKEAQLRFESMFNNMFQFLGLLRPDGTLVEVNNTALEFAGLTREQARGRKFWDAPWWNYDTEVQERLILAINKAAEGEFVRYDVDVRGKDGMITIDFSLRPVISEAGEIVYLIPEGRDISDKKVLEDRLEYEKSLFLQTFENSPIGATLISPEGRFVRVNGSLCKMLGYTARELMKTDFQSLTHPEDLEKDLSFLFEVLEGKRNGYHMEKRYFRKDGKIIHAELHVSCIRNAQGKVESFISQIVDKTESKINQDRIQEGLELQKSILDSSTSSIMAFDAVYDEQGTIADFEWTLINEPGIESLGQSRDHLIGGRLTERLPSFKQNGLFDRMLEVASSGKTAEFEQELESQQDEENWIYVRIVKHASGVIMAFKDISKVKEAELKQRELIQQLQMRNNQLHDFNFMLSHNLRSPFSNVGGLLGFLEESEDKEEQKMIIDRMKKVVKQVEDVMENLTDAVRMQSALDSKAEPVDLRTLLEKVESILKENLDQVNGEMEIDTSAWNLITYPRETLESILINLLSNAIKYRSFERTLHIKFETLLEDETRILRVSDNGSGIDLSRHGEHIFKLNKTFHRDRPGKGLGLYMTRYQVQALGGDIKVESELDKGTTFIIEF